MMSMEEYKKRVQQYMPQEEQKKMNIIWKEEPIFYKSSQGSRVWDINNKEYLDLELRNGVSILGHGNKEYKVKLKKIMDKTAGVSRGDIEAEALEALHAFMPEAERISFGLSEEELLNKAAYLAKAYTNRKYILSFYGHEYGKEYDNKDYILLSWNDIESFETVLQEKKGEIAAVIMEPICTSSTSILPQDDYLKKVREKCTDNGILLIFNEAITGLRMGLGGVQKKYGVVPDITILAGALTGGSVPMAALIGKKDVLVNSYLSDRMFENYEYGYSLGLAGVKATLDILCKDQGQIYQEMQNYAKQIHDVMKQMATQVGMPLVIQGLLLCSSIHCRNSEVCSLDDYTTKDQMKDLLLNTSLQKNGILIANISNIYPNISLSQADISWFETHVGKALEETKELIEIYM